MSHPSRRGRPAHDLRIGAPVRSPEPALPCMPCPHGSACCRYGTSLTADEAQAIAAAHGPDSVVRLVDDHRTAVRYGGCVFLAGNGCTIHDRSYYPATCRHFPWRDREGGPYAGDPAICPEMAKGGPSDALSPSRGGQPGAMKA